MSESQTLSHVGEVAALGAATSWAISPLLFTAAGRRIGSHAVNVFRIVLAIGLFAATVWITGTSLAIAPRQLGVLALSGIVGLALGDGALFHALVILGPRRVTLLMALTPLFVALLMVPALGETIGVVGLAGMAVTLGGIAWVITQRVPDGERHGSVALGIGLGILSALGQAVGLLLAKAGMGLAEPGSLLAAVTFSEGAATPVGPLAGSTVRMLAAGVVLLGYSVARREVGRLREAARDGRALHLTSWGALLGPYVGMWLSLVAAERTTTAVAATIMASSPVLVIPLARIVHAERAGVRGWAGALVATAGVAVLAFRVEIAALLVL